MNIKPLQDRLIVKRVMPEQPKSAGGILLPPVEESQDTPYTGIVVAAGPGKVCKPFGQDLLDVLQDLINACRTIAESGHGMAHQQAQSCIEGAMEKLAAHQQAVARTPMSVKVGDLVVYSRHGHQEFRVDGENFVTFGEDSVIGVLELPLK